MDLAKTSTSGGEVLLAGAKEISNTSVGTGDGLLSTLFSSPPNYASLASLAAQIQSSFLQLPAYYQVLIGAGVLGCTASLISWRLQSKAEERCQHSLRGRCYPNLFPAFEAHSDEVSLDHFKLTLKRDQLVCQLEEQLQFIRTAHAYSASGSSIIGATGNSSTTANSTPAAASTLVAAAGDMHSHTSHPLGPFLYDGHAGLAFMYWRLASAEQDSGLRTQYLWKAQVYVETSIRQMQAEKSQGNELDDTNVGLFYGHSGVAAVAVLVYHAVGDILNRDRLLGKLASFEEHAIHSCHLCPSVTIGASGYLLALEYVCAQVNEANALLAGPRKRVLCALVKAGAYPLRSASASSSVLSATAAAAAASSVVAKDSSASATASASLAPSSSASSMSSSLSPSAAASSSSSSSSSTSSAAAAASSSPSSLLRQQLWWNYHASTLHPLYDFLHASASRGVISRIVATGVWILSRVAYGVGSLFYFQPQPLGMLTGQAGCLYAVLRDANAVHSVLSAQHRSLLVASLDYLIARRFPSGNFPTGVVRTHLDGEIVQFCDGAPGMCLLFARAYEVFGYHRFLAAAREAGEVVWKYGLLRKGHSLCHGIAGNAYAFLALYRITQKPVYLYRVCAFAEFVCDRELAAMRDPTSLLGGDVGVVVFLNDLVALHSDARFPFIE
eukprot:CAMPEP_0177664972 /NCGR_PEP_ID=MMETSP0447-20121125/20799_1 /TAXON_ID=0 /ORGANISM="Stygamoeba regulata, Strain BSH-02190019" /LENGTH=669 /DNA_ID=CAMNT_0019171021 /DNA_START=90 /DNA_END=2099 /DNA_ORIENTATION=-